MIGMCVVVAVTVLNSPEVNTVPTGSAMRMLERLVAAVSDPKPNASKVEQAKYMYAKRDVQGLMIYMGKVQEVIEIGNWQPAFYQNYLTVIQQITAAGVNSALLPEEALTWHRAGLDLAAEQLRWMTWQVDTGKQPKQNLLQAQAHFARSRFEYRKALAELVRIAP